MIKLYNASGVPYVIPDGKIKLRDGGAWVGAKIYLRYNSQWVQVYPTGEYVPVYGFTVSSIISSSNRSDTTMTIKNNEAPL